ncbi:MAG: hypothetical protein ACRKFN_04760 [Desulfitobacterium sp.]
MFIQAWFKLFLATVMDSLDEVVLLAQKDFALYMRAHRSVLQKVMR